MSIATSALVFCLAVAWVSMTASAQAVGSKSHTRRLSQSAHPAKEGPSGKAKGSADSTPAIGHLETKDRLISIHASPKGPLYTVQTRDGRVLHRNLSERELQAKVPELHKLVKDAVADKAKKDRIVLDATAASPKPR